MNQPVQLRPAMGWNSWNAFRCYDIDESMVLAQADALLRLGLAEAGYNVVVIDDGWQAPDRTADGRLQACPARFPHGIGWLAEQIHARGLRVGLYLSPGLHTCAQIYDAYSRYTTSVAGASRAPAGSVAVRKPPWLVRFAARNKLVPPVAHAHLGSYGHEERDLRQLVDWGVDYLKYDWCDGDAGTGMCQQGAFSKMRALIDESGREMVYSISEYGESQPWEWAGGVANSWRTTPDILPTAGSIFDIVRRSVQHTAVNRPGAVGDLDMLQIGNFGRRGRLWLNAPAKIAALGLSHVRMWGLLQAPLMIGTDLRSLQQDDATVQALKDPFAVWVNQQLEPGEVTLRTSDLGSGSEVMQLRRVVDDATGTVVVDLWVNTSSKEAFAVMPPMAEFRRDRGREGCSVQMLAVGEQYIDDPGSSTWRRGRRVTLAPYASMLRVMRCER